MRIRYLGHSSFLLDFGCLRVVTDPYDSYVGYTMPQVRADIVTCSHFHEDHHCIDNVMGSPRVLDSVCSLVQNGVTIDSFECYHDEVKGAKRGTNRIFRFKYDGITLVHMGDIGEPCSEFCVKGIERADFLFIPVGGYYTINAPEAKEYGKLLNARHIIPMHYKLGGEFPIAGVNSFADLFTGQVSYVGTEMDVKDCHDSKVLVFCKE